MREKIRDKERLEHILNAANILLDRSLTEWEEAINSDPVMFYGMAKLLEMIGEAAYKLTKEFKEEYKDIPWRYIEDMRHVLVHGYYRIGYPQMAQTIREDLPGLRDEIIKIVSGL